jgi:hypothetical protein
LGGDFLNLTYPIIAGIFLQIRDRHGVMTASGFEIMTGMTLRGLVAIARLGVILGWALVML